MDVRARATLLGNLAGFGLLGSLPYPTWSARQDWASEMQTATDRTFSSLECDKIQLARCIGLWLVLLCRDFQVLLGTFMSDNSDALYI